MKKILLLLAILLGFSSCQNWLNINQNPNTPTNVPASLILPQAEAGLAVRVGGNLFNTGGFFVQYWEQAPEANQYNDLSIFNLKAEYFDNDYTELYSVLNNVEQVRQQAKASEDWGDYLAGTVIRAYTFQVIVDAIGDAPYTQAIQGSANFQPKYDSGDTIYAGILSELNDALSKVSTMTFGSVYSTDMLCGGVLSQWIGFANALKLKILMRESNVKDVSNQVMSLISQNSFFTGNIEFTDFSDESGKRNPWYETNKIGLAVNNHVASYTFVASMANDKRMAAIFDSVDGSFKGIVAGSEHDGTKHTADYSLPIFRATAPVYLYTQAELQFFIAEAQYRWGDKSKAKAAYELGIDNAFSLWGLNGSSTYASGGIYAWNDSNALPLIYIQKWLSLAGINPYEAWCEQRRTGYPEFDPNLGTAIVADPTLYSPYNLITPTRTTLNSGQMIQRFYYPQVSTSRNPNAPVQKTLVTPIFWHK